MDTTQYFLQIGNTHTTLARSAEGRDFHTLRLPTPMVFDTDFTLPEPWIQWLEQGPLWLGGVVPEAERAWREWLTARCVTVRTPDAAVFERLVPNDYEKGRMGFDRRCKLVAAALDWPGQDSIVVDAGTAVTLDLWADGRFLGGRILPGEEAGLRALHESAALLPSLAPLPPGAAGGLGNDTAACMRLGVRGMVRAAVAAAVVEYRRLAPAAQVLLTGGGADILRNEGLEPAFYLPHLVLRGFRLWAQLTPPMARS